MSDPSVLNRQILSKFLPDARSIRAFEELISMVSTSLPAGIVMLQGLIDDLAAEQGTIDSKSTQALALLQAISDSLDQLVKAPPPEGVTRLREDVDSLSLLPRQEADQSGSAATVQANLDAHELATGTAVHGLGSASTHAAADFDLAGAAAAAQAASQPLDADLTAIAALVSAADKLPYSTGAGAWALTQFTAAGRAIVDDADATAQRVTLGLVIGTNVQAYNANLTAIDQGLTTTSGVVFLTAQAKIVTASRPSGDAGTAVESIVSHADNSNPASHARFLAQTAGASAGDSYTQYNNSVVNWAIGLDNSAGDALVISAASTLGTSNIFTSSTSASEFLTTLKVSDIQIGKTSFDTTTAGIVSIGGGAYTCFIRDSNPPLAVGRITTDGTIIELSGPGGTVQGTISVSGATVSYNAFLGSHWAQLLDQSRMEIPRGTVLESLDELCSWPNEPNEKLPKVKISDTEKSPNVYGVFLGWDDDEFSEEYQMEDVEKEFSEVKLIGEQYIMTTGIRIERQPKMEEHLLFNTDGSPVMETIQEEIYEDVVEPVTVTVQTIEGEQIIQVGSKKVGERLILPKVERQATFKTHCMENRKGTHTLYVAAVGTFLVRMQKGQPAQRGLIESAGDGTARFQADDLYRSSTLGKIISTTVIETYADGSFLLPCKFDAG